VSSDSDHRYGNAHQRHPMDGASLDAEWDQHMFRRTCRGRVATTSSLPAQTQGVPICATTLGSRPADDMRLDAAQNRL